MQVVERINDTLAAKLNDAAQPVIDDWKSKSCPIFDEILDIFDKHSQCRNQS